MAKGQGAVLDRLIGAAYDAALDVARWSGFLDGLANTLQGIAPGVFLADRETDAPRFTAVDGMDLGPVQAYEEHYKAIDQRRPRIQALPEGAVFCGQELMSDRELVQTEFYNDFMRPQGFFHIAGGIPVKDARRLGVLRVIRPPHAKAFDRADLHLLHSLVPHVGRALRIHDELSQAKAASRSFAEVLSVLPIGVILLDGNGHVLEANGAAEFLLTQRDGLWVERGELRALRLLDTDTLHTLIAVAVGTRNGHERSGGATVVARPSGSHPLDVLVAPLSRDTPATDVRHAAAVVLVTDPERRAEADTDAIARYLRITRREAAVVALLVQGMSTADAAHELGIRKSTVETHIKHVLGKTGAGKQRELVRLVLQSPAVARTLNRFLNVLVSVLELAPLVWNTAS